MMGSAAAALFVPMMVRKRAGATRSPVVPRGVATLRAICHPAREVAGRDGQPPTVSSNNMETVFFVMTVKLLGLLPITAGSMLWPQSRGTATGHVG